MATGGFLTAKLDTDFIVELDWNTKKSYDMIGVEPLIKIMSDELRNVLICRKNDSDLRQSAFEWKPLW